MNNVAFEVLGQGTKSKIRKRLKVWDQDLSHLTEKKKKACMKYLQLRSIDTQLKYKH